MSQLAPGSTLAHYTIREQLGAGGMGEVWLADDTRLHRPVALKVLKSHDRSQEAIDRFVFEARAASALNHPNAAHIYEIAQLGEVIYIAMEYVEGESLETRLERGPLAAEEARAIAMQLADALSVAHAKGIVHRDLKPGNVVINPRGQAKILDFGIAKRVRPDEPLVSARTTPSTVLGTLPYMSPEQVRARPIDHRSDIFSFGVVLYEMVTGRRPFDGESLLDTVRNIAETSPSMDDVPLAAAIAKCLEKDPARRYQDAQEIVSDLRAPNAGAAAGRLPHFRMIVAVLAVVAAIPLVMWLVPDRKSVPPTLSKLTAAPGLEDEPAISPDGNSIAYTSDERGNLDLFVRPIGGGEAVRITDSDADDAQPAWSPDGARIAFVSARERSGRLSIVLGQALGNFVNAQGGDLFVVSSRGGAATRLIDNAFYPAWSPDGAWIVFQSARSGRWELWKVPANGGAPLRLTNDADFDYQPAWSPDGESIVYASGSPGDYRVKVMRAAGGSPRVITDGKDSVLIKPVFTADGRAVIYSSMRGGSMNLWRVPVAKRAEPERVTLGEGDDVHATVRGARLVYATVRQTPDLWTLDVATGKSEQLTFDTGKEEFPHRSRDGVLAFSSDRGGGGDAIWLLDGRGQMRQFAAKSSIGHARWSPDGKRLVYRFDDRGQTSVAVQELGAREPRVIARLADAPSWSPDGRWLTFSKWADERLKGQIYIASADGSGEIRKLTELDLVSSYPTFSPDGRFISFQATRDDGTRHVWVVEVATGAVRQLTRGASEDSHPQWSPVKRDEILFIRNHENLMTVSVSTGEIRPLTRYSHPNTVLDYPSWSPDGTRVEFSIARKRGDLYMLESERK